jgi:uncharacterized protein with FMN-binding domain
MYKYDKINSGECINCFKCVSVCPRKNTKASVGSQDIAPLAAGLTAAAAIMGLYYVGRIASDNIAYAAPQATTIQISESSSVSGIYTDGTYTGSADGYRGTTNVQVTVYNGYITDISVLSTGDDSEFFSRAKTSIISAIISSQSAEVDAVTGATYSSNAIMESVANALGTINITISEAASPSPSPSPSDSGTSSTQATAVPTTSSGAYTDGTYTGSGTGFRGETNVSVTVSEGSITDIEIVSYQDDRQYFKRASSTIISEIISSQSTDVNAVSGATFSSNGIMEAVANALSVEYTNPNSTLQSGKGHSRQ